MMHQEEFFAGTTTPESKHRTACTIIVVGQGQIQNNSKVIKEHLTKMYNDLSSSYDALNQETNENLKMIENILLSPQQVQYPLEACDFLFGSLKACFGSPGHTILEEKMKAKFKQLTEVQKV